MALTRDFKETVVARARRDPRFREALFTEAINAYLGGDLTTGKAILRDLVNATVGFEELAAELDKPSKSLHRMLAPHGNPSTENFFGDRECPAEKNSRQITCDGESGLIEEPWTTISARTIKRWNPKNLTCGRMTWLKTNGRSCCGSFRKSGQKVEKLILNG